MQVCVDCTLSPFGRWATRGMLAAHMLVAGALVDRKCLFVPESRIAHRLMVLVSVEMVFRRTAAANA